MKFNELKIGDYFTTYEQGKLLVGVKVQTGRAIDLGLGRMIDMHFNRRVDYGKLSNLDIEKTVLARAGADVILATPTENGRWLVHKFLIVATEFRITESLDFPEKTGEGRESRDEVDIILTQLAKHLTLAVNWAESAKEILKVT